MKTKLFTMIAAVGALASLATGCDKPDTTPSCLVGRGIWVASYQKVDETPGATQCVQRLGDLLNINKYQAFPAEGQPAPVSSVAIKPYVYRYVRMAAADQPTPTTDVTARTDLAFGNLQSNFSDANNNCTVPTLSTAALTTVGGSVPADVDTKGVPTSYKFSNVQFLDDRLHPGQQMQADLEYTHGDCTQHYKVTALYGLNFLTGGPTVCLSQIDCDPHISADPNRLDLQLGFPAFATGINPDYPVFCDTALGDYTGWMALLFGGSFINSGIGVCNLDGAYGTTCDHNSNPDCWKSGPKAQAEAAANP